MLFIMVPLKTVSLHASHKIYTHVSLYAIFIVEAAMHTAQQHSAETARLFYQIDVS
jgi:hypothetical protein